MCKSSWNFILLTGILSLVQRYQRSKYIGRPMWPCEVGRFRDGKACKEYSSRFYSMFIINSHKYVTCRSQQLPKVDDSIAIEW